MILFRQCDRRFPFLWEAANQPAARWHADGEGPAQYLADTPSGAWAEFLRHEGITNEADLAGVERALWAVEVPVDAILFGVPTCPRKRHSEPSQAIPSAKPRQRVFAPEGRKVCARNQPLCFPVAPPAG